MNAPCAVPSPPTTSAPASGRSIAALVLGILGLLSGPIWSPVAWYLGWAELRDIARGLAAESGRDYATAGMIMGIIGTVLVAFALLVLAGIALVVLAVVAVAR